MNVAELSVDLIVGAATVERWFRRIPRALCSNLVKCARNKIDIAKIALRLREFMWVQPYHTHTPKASRSSREMSAAE